MIIKDFHLHTAFSPDSDAKAEHMLEKATKLGFDEVAFTDHIDYTSEGKELSFHINYNEYIEVFNELKNKYRNKISIVFGVEIGIEPQLKQTLKDFTGSFPFEFIIGSSHTVEKKDLYTNEYFVGKDKAIAHRIYLEEVLENIVTIDCFDVYGHLDYISRYGNYENNRLAYREYKVIIDEILTELIKRGKGIEINTSGFRYGLNDIYPSLEVLKAYKNLGGEIITVGSDAHYPKAIGERFDYAEKMLREAGFKAYTVFRGRTPNFIEL